MFSTKGRYAIRFMIDLAEQEGDRPVPLEDVSGRQEISKKYLEIVVKILVQSGLVKGTSGKGGGYRLLRKPEEYTILEILEITEGPVTPVACLSECSEPCDRESFCKTLPMWKEYYRMTRSFFAGITIQDLVDGKLPVPELFEPEEHTV